jgi:hypothetical protein
VYINVTTDIDVTSRSTLFVALYVPGNVSGHIQPCSPQTGRICDNINTVCRTSKSAGTLNIDSLLDAERAEKSPQIILPPNILPSPMLSQAVSSGIVHTVACEDICLPTDEVTDGGETPPSPPSARVS